MVCLLCRWRGGSGRKVLCSLIAVPALTERAAKRCPVSAKLTMPPSLINENTTSTARLSTTSFPVSRQTLREKADHGNLLAEFQLDFLLQVAGGRYAPTGWLGGSSRDRPNSFSRKVPGR